MQIYAKILNVYIIGEKNIAEIYEISRENKQKSTAVDLLHPIFDVKFLPSAVPF